MNNYHLILLLFMISACSSQRTSPVAPLTVSCAYPTGSECSTSEYCIFIEPSKSVCAEKETQVPEVAFPVSSRNPIICTQPVKSAAGRTHSYLNTAYAVDLSSPKSTPSATLLAAIDGEVIIHQGCDNHDEAELNNDPCGMGFGNWVLIHNKETKLMAFYAHLSTNNLEDGQWVKKGAVVGVEGKSGQAGHRHLHFSIHRNTLNLDRSKILQYGIWLPPSIPFLTTIKKGETRQTVSVADLPCQDNNNLTRTPFYGGE